ncbi:hypothetical protein FNV43_RR21520 [Rhamnella rubrinervis]|uniref:Uncharacterized protein n=1 Tax=Rhamnella rubrinervis TaxID=2594499 RepID=A0A8K0DY15_9ROSA|nr:hypothetical protein FNV43_RR21520 [Rhamnella rubrinervis]
MLASRARCVGPNASTETKRQSVVVEPCAMPMQGSRQCASDSNAPHTPGPQTLCQRVTHRSLSISISGGKETYKDSLVTASLTECSVENRGPLLNCSQEAPHGATAQVPRKGRSRAPIGRKFRPRLNTGETDSKQVPRGKDEKDFEKRVKECLKLSGGKRMGPRCAGRMWNGESRSADRLGRWTDADWRGAKPGRSHARGDAAAAIGWQLRCRAARHLAGRPRVRESTLRDPKMVNYARSGRPQETRVEARSRYRRANRSSDLGGRFAEPLPESSSKWAILVSESGDGMNEAGLRAQLLRNLEPTKGVGRLRQQDGGHGSRIR